MLTELHYLRGTGDYIGMPNNYFAELTDLNDNMPRYIDLSDSMMEIQKARTECYEHNDILWLGSGPSDNFDDDQPCGQDNCTVCPHNGNISTDDFKWNESVHADNGAIENISLCGTFGSPCKSHELSAMSNEKQISLTDEVLEGKDHSWFKPEEHWWGL